MTHKVLEVKSVSLALLQSKPPQLAITATGSVPTTGYTDPQLVPYLYTVPPSDGIYDFDLVATPPGGIAGDVVLPVVATFVMEQIPTGLKGVRVHASSNEKDARLDTKGECYEVSFS